MYTIVETILKNHYFSLIIGVILGMFITTIYFKKIKENKESIWSKVIATITVALRKWPMETMIALITGLFIVGQLILSIFNVSLSNNSLGIMLSFFTSIIFSWLLTKYSSEREFNERQKETAIRSYRHSLNIKNKLFYDIKVIELLSLDIDECACNKDGNCDLKHHMKRASDFLVAAHKDSAENMNDWGDILSDDFNRINEIDCKNKLIQSAEMKIQECDPIEEKEEIESLKGNITEYNKRLNYLRECLNSKVRYSLETQESDENKFLSQVEDEIDMRKTKKIQKELGKEISITLKEKVQKTS